MKILHISSARIDYPGGTEKIILELAKRQAKKHKVTVLQTNLYEENKKFKEKSKIGKIKIITCKNDRFLGGFGYSADFKKQLRYIWKDYDIIHIHGHGRFTSNFTMGFLDKKKPFIYSGQGFFHSKKNNNFKKIYDLLFKKRLKKASFCTALTGLEKIKLLDLGVEMKKIKIIPGGINFDKLQRLKNLNSLRKKYLGKDFNKKVLLYVGRIHESKGLQYVLEAIENINLKFLIVGKDAGYESTLKLKVKNLKIGNKVKFLGAVNEKELIELYNVGDIFVLFSDWEGFGLVIIEAMAAGMPVIGRNRGAIPLLIKNNFNGFVVNNIEELKKRLNLLLKNNKKRKELGKNAKEFAKEFDWKNITKKHLKLYKKAIKNFNEK